jgi:hypothetical protein
MYSAMEMQPELVRMLPEDEESLRFLVMGQGGRSPMFEYVFDKNLSVRSVLSMDGNAAVHDSLRTVGRISSKYDKKYLEGLKGSVKYWDGHRWGSTPTRVLSKAVAVTYGPPSSN